jgi:hypothetical protein
MNKKLLNKILNTKGGDLLFKAVVYPTILCVSMAGAIMIRFGKN